MKEERTATGSNWARPGGEEGRGECFGDKNSVIYMYILSGGGAELGSRSNDFK